MADYWSFPRGPALPFSRVLTSDPMADVVAGIAGAPGDIASLAYPRNDPRFPVMPSLPTYTQVRRGIDQANENPPVANDYWSLWSMLPELTTLLRGAPQPSDMRPWARNIYNQTQMPDFSINQLLGGVSPAR